MAKQPIVVKRYKNETEYQDDANKMLKSGYAIQSTVNEQPRTGCMRFIMLGGHWRIGIQA